MSVCDGLPTRCFGVMGRPHTPFTSKFRHALRGSGGIVDTGLSGDERQATQEDTAQYMYTSSNLKATQNSTLLRLGYSPKALTAIVLTKRTHTYRHTALPAGKLDTLSAELQLYSLQ